MSNIESTKSAYKTFATGDLAALKEYFTPEITWYSSDEVAPGGDYQGLDAVMTMMSRLAEHWTSMSLEPTDYFDAGDCVVVTGNEEFTNDSGSVTCPYAHVLRFNADGKVVRSEFYTDSAKAAKLQHLR
ncbi:nuclear transport factor 2 family protein [Mycobacterium koreense]|uniref:Uncharacterized protein n=1 Tax=Mycolicibacillus koreensis TaxID=1069220 RepID=A0A7I7S973_9MYCO|nr:nuclear transport factor 2 family protein [Mycolicibacillus koreensis]MCV7249515.1 nuclear transport factor 2 family protein [Mycolicibacillus koreensis]OSC30821.1 hypothetical protein B8W67_16640 [Mycolicibacillus koreensis]BBY53432.1 hypothetical protein MKOR_06830 [Mycolicibacillus koreensis]